MQTRVGPPGYAEPGKGLLVLQSAEESPSPTPFLLVFERFRPEAHMLMLLLSCAAMAAGSPLPPAPPSTEDLAVWSERLGVALRQTPSVVLQPLQSGLALVGPGQSLALVEVSGGGAPVATALGPLLDPFAAAGLALSEPVMVPCTLAKAVVQCTQVTVTVGPGKTLVATAASAPQGDWVAVCLDRRSGAAGACTGVVEVAAAAAP